MCRREWTTVCAAFCVRGPRWSTGRIFCTGVDDQPEPQHLGTTAEPGSEFVQLQVRKVELEEEALVQGLRMLTRTGQKGWEWWLVESRRPVLQPKDLVLRPEQRAPGRPAGKGF